MIVIWNRLTPLYVICCAPVGVTICGLFSFRDDLIAPLVAILVAAVDLFFRYRRSRSVGEEAFTDSRAGAQFFYIPLWIVGLLFFVGSFFLK